MIMLSQDIITLSRDMVLPALDIVILSRDIIVLSIDRIIVSRHRMVLSLFAIFPKPANGGRLNSFLQKDIPRAKFTDRKKTPWF